MSKLEKGSWKLEWMGTGQWMLKSKLHDIGKISGGNHQQIEEVKDIIDLFKSYLIIRKSNQEYEKRN